MLSQGLQGEVAADDLPLYFLQPEVRMTSTNPADIEISSNSLWIVEKYPAVSGGPLLPNTPYRLKHFASSKYLSLQKTEGGPHKLAMTTEATDDTFWLFHALDQATRIVDSSTSLLRIQVCAAEGRVLCCRGWGGWRGQAERRRGTGHQGVAGEGKGREGARNTRGSGSRRAGEG